MMSEIMTAYHAFPAKIHTYHKYDVLILVPLSSLRDIHTYIQSFNYFHKIIPETELKLREAEQIPRFIRAMGKNTTA